MSEPLHIVCPHCQATNRLPQERLADGGVCGRCKQKLFTGRPVSLGGNAFLHMLERTDVPVVVDFWAPWCGPCKVFAPIFEQAAAQLEPRARLVKLNTEDEPQLATRYGIRSIPTLAILRGGRELARQSGAMNLASFVQWVRASIGR